MITVYTVLGRQNSVLRTLFLLCFGIELFTFLLQVA